MRRPISIKKCQDDQGFDITQDDIVGHLFNNLATVRVIKASPMPNMRDSVPPESALRYAPIPNASHKREREGSVRPNGISPPYANKRQRISNQDPDPDCPIPSRETESEISGSKQLQRGEVPTPSSQGKKMSIGGNRNSRDVRVHVSIIPETPQGSPNTSPEPPVLPDSSYTRNHYADRLGEKSTVSKVRNQSPRLSQIGQVSPSRDGSVPAPSVRSKSASYHIPRTTERRSFSTPATSPEGVEVHSVHGDLTLSNKYKSPLPASVSSVKVFGKPASKFNDGGNMYDAIESDGDRPATVLRKTKESLKMKKSSPFRLPGEDWASDFSSPPDGARHISRQHDHSANTVPNSGRGHEQQRQAVVDERKSQKVDSDAMTQRKRETEAEHSKIQDKARLSKGELDQEDHAAISRAAELEKKRKERVEAGKRVQEEAEKSRLEEAARSRREEQEQEKKAADAKAARLEKVQLEKIEAARRLEEESAVEKARLKKERDDEELSKRLQRPNKDDTLRGRQNAQRQDREESLSEEAERVHQEQEAPTKDKRLVESVRKKTSSTSVEYESIPAVSEKTPVRPQSSTPLIPSGRKSALKSSVSFSSSPIITRQSPSTSIGSSTKERRVSFVASDPKVGNEPPAVVKKEFKQTRILPPAKGSATPKSKPNSSGSKGSKYYLSNI
jgi:hypothetical protein